MAKATRKDVPHRNDPVILELTSHEAAVLKGVLGPISCPGEAIFQIYDALSNVKFGLDCGPRNVFGGDMTTPKNPSLTPEYFEFSNKEAHTYDDAV